MTNPQRSHNGNIMKTDTKKSFEIEALEKFMKARNLTRKDLEIQVGSRSRVSEILNGKRQLSISMLKNIVNNWDMDANLLLKDPAFQSVKTEFPKDENRQKTDSIVWMLD